MISHQANVSQQDPYQDLRHSLTQKTNNKLSKLPSKLKNNLQSVIAQIEKVNSLKLKVLAAGYSEDLRFSFSTDLIVAKDSESIWQTYGPKNSKDMYNKRPLRAEITLYPI